MNHNPGISSLGDDSNIIFCVPEGLTLGGATTWAVETAKALTRAGMPAVLGIHSSRHNNPPIDFNLGANDRIIDLTHLPPADSPDLNPEDYVAVYRQALPGILIPSWSSGTYALAVICAGRWPEKLRVIGMAHSDEDGYYRLLTYYEGVIHKFIVANARIQRKLGRALPHRVADIVVKPCPVHVPPTLERSYSPPSAPLQLVYGGRIAHYQKRVFDLIELIAALDAAEVDFNFRVIGGGADKDEFIARVARLPGALRARVSVEDAVPLAQLPGIWRAADLNILVSDFEGVSNSMLMGMAEGSVPVMTAVSGTLEVIQPGVDGYLAPVGDMAEMARIIKMLDEDRGRLAELGRNAHHKALAGYSMQDYLGFFTQMAHEVRRQAPRPWPPAIKPLSPEALESVLARLSSIDDEEEPASSEATETKTILFVSHDAGWGGAPKALYLLIKGLDRGKWTPVVALPGHGDLETKFAEIGVRTVVTPLAYITTDAKNYSQQYEVFSSGLEARVQALAELIERERADLVLTNTICILDAALAARRAGVPHVWNICELSSIDDKLTPVLDYPAFYATLDALSEKLVVVSQAVQEEICRFFPSGKVQVIHTGIESVPQPQGVDKRSVLGVAADAPVVTFVGYLSERKGVLELADIAGVTARRFPQVRFVVVGKTEGAAYRRLVQLIQAKGLEEHFVFLGFRHDLPEIIACSDVVIVPSHADPFPLIALDAMDAGKPVVATRSGGLAEAVVDGETGYLAPVESPYELAQGVIRLLEDPEKAQRMGQQGRRRLQECFSYAGYVGKFERLLDEAVSQPQPQARQRAAQVENIIHLTTIAAQARVRLARLGRTANPLEDVEALLKYPGYVPHVIEPAHTAERRPKVSVCVPVYNGERYLRGCIESILAQTFTDFELLIVDDASSDGSRQIVKSFGDRRIRYFRNEHNLGLVGNWNRCLELSNGEVVCIFHQDDLMHPENLEKKLAILHADERIGMVYSDVQIIDSEGRPTSYLWNLLDPNVDFTCRGLEFFELMLVNLNLVCCPGVVARRACYETVGGFDARLPFTVDMEMWMRISLFYDVVYLSQPLLQYRKHESSETNRFAILDLLHIYLGKRMVLEKYPDRLDASYWRILVEDSSQRAFERTIHHYYAQNYTVARQYLAFLQKIRGQAGERGLFDAQVEQLQKYVHQANALHMLGLSQPGN